MPPILLKKQALFKPDPHLPDDVKRKRVGTTVTGSYKLCISQDGSIGSVEPVNSIPNADDAIIATLRTWRYQPQPVSICFIQFLEFLIDGAAAYPGGSAPEAARIPVRPLIKPASASTRPEKSFAPER